MVWAPETRFGRHIPVILLTGFLGSGKTTLLNALLGSPHFADTAVVVNEFGAVALDHRLIGAATNDTIVLANGCLCCAAGADIEAAIGRIFRKGAADGRPPYQRLVVETSGLADPEETLAGLLGNPIGARFLWLAGIVATVSALHGSGELARHREARAQAQIADRIVVTKTDLATPAQRARLAADLDRINTRAGRIAVPPVPADPATLLPTAFDARDPSPIGGWARAATRHAHHSHVRHSHAHHSHAASHATTLYAAAPLDWRRFQLWLGREVRTFGRALLRMKGIVDVAGGPPVVVHAVQRVLHVPVGLAAWPDGDHRTTLVFITESDGAESDGAARLRASWADFLAEPDLSRQSSPGQ